MATDVLTVWADHAQTRIKTLPVTIALQGAELVGLASAAEVRAYSPLVLSH